MNTRPIRLLALVAACLAAAPHGARAATFVVDDTYDDSSTCAPSGCSLREAILAANANPGPDTITFNLGAGVPVVPITLGPLPAITDPVDIDGATGGATRVWIRPQPNASVLAPGLRVTSGSTVIRNLVVTGFLHGIELATTGGNVVTGCYLGVDGAGTGAAGNFASGIQIAGTTANVIGGVTPDARNVLSANTYGVTITGAAAAGNIVLGNYIGTDATGAAALGNSQAGVMVMNGAHDNLIGEATAGGGNVISGNGFYGVDLNGDTASNNSVLGNLIGTNAAGDAPLGNGRIGVAINSPDNRIGGTSLVARNVISANGWFGVWIDGAAARRNVVRGNRIGILSDTPSPFGNALGGVEIRNDAAQNKIGGTAPGAGNAISANGGPGVQIEGGPGNAIRQNAIAFNAGLGIDLGADGVTPNDGKDPDVGPNLLQNYPRLTSAAANNGFVHVLGLLNSVPSSSFTVELFATVTCDPSGYGEGLYFLGSVDVTTNALGKAPIDTTVALPLLAGGQLTATATSQSGSTSEFSRCIGVAF